MFFIPLIAVLAPLLARGVSTWVRVPIVVFELVLGILIGPGRARLGAALRLRRPPLRLRARDAVLRGGQRDQLRGGPGPADHPRIARMAHEPRDRPGGGRAHRPRRDGRHHRRGAELDRPRHPDADPPRRGRAAHPVRPRGDGDRRRGRVRPAGRHLALPRHARAGNLDPRAHRLRRGHGRRDRARHAHVARAPARLRAHHPAHIGAVRRARHHHDPRGAGRPQHPARSRHAARRLRRRRDLEADHAQRAGTRPRAGRQQGRGDRVRLPRADLLRLHRRDVRPRGAARLSLGAGAAAAVLRAAARDPGAARRSCRFPPVRPGTTARRSRCLRRRGCRSSSP